MNRPENYQYDIDVSEVAYLVSVLSLSVGYLILPTDVLRKIENLCKFGGGVSDSGEGRWTVNACCGSWCTRSVITTAL